MDFLCRRLILMAAALAAASCGSPMEAGLRVGYAGSLGGYAHAEHSAPLIHEDFDIENVSGIVVGSHFQATTGYWGGTASLRWQAFDWESSLGPFDSDDQYEAIFGMRLYPTRADERPRWSPYLGPEVRVMAHTSRRAELSSTLALGAALTAGIECRISDHWSVDGQMSWSWYPGRGTEDEIQRIRETQFELAVTWW